MIVFLYCCDTIHLQGFKAVSLKTANGNNSAVMHSPLCIDNATALKASTSSNGHYLASEPSAPKKNKMAATETGHNKTSCRPAELTLEYMAVQLPRSHAFQ